MKTLEEIKGVLRERKEEIRKRYEVVILGIFGSYARGEQSQLGDVDILVEVERPIGLKFFELWDEIEKTLGVDVDLLTIRAVKQKPMLWESIRRDLTYV